MFDHDRIVQQPCGCHFDLVRKVKTYYCEEHGTCQVCLRRAREHSIAELDDCERVLEMDL